MLTLALFVYNRPEHTWRTLNCLQKTNGSENCQLYIFSDGAKDSNDKALVNEVRNICKSAKKFDKIAIIEREKNLGLANNIINGVTQLFKETDRVVVLEDDLLVSYGFLEYMRSALDFYKDKPIFSISGYTPNVEIPYDYINSTYIVPRTCSWGWATWRDRWNRIDWTINDFDSFINNRVLRDSFNKGGDDLTTMLLKQQLGIINSWSIRFTYAAFKQKMLSVYPVRSLIENIGVDGSGTNMKASNRYETMTTHTIDSNLFVNDFKVNTSILNSFCSFYNTSVIRKIINFFKLKRYLNSL